MARLRLGVLVSGNGSNLQAIIDAIARDELAAEIATVISNTPKAYALERAAKNGVVHVVIDHHDYPTRKDFDQKLVECLKQHQVDLVCLAGFMRILSAEFVKQFPLRVMNVHPALLPAFKGLWGHHVHEAVLKSGVRFSGCTVHFVTEDVDGGPIIVQRVVPVEDDDVVETLAARVREQEHQAYVEAIRLFAEKRLTVENGRVRIRR